MSPKAIYRVVYAYSTEVDPTGEDAPRAPDIDLERVLGGLPGVSRSGGFLHVDNPKQSKLKDVLASRNSRKGRLPLWREHRVSLNVKPDVLATS